MRCYISRKADQLRQVAAKHFRKEIDAAYDESENASAASQGKAKL